MVLRPTSHPSKKKQQGFTLVEVLTALAILALVLMTALRALSFYGQNIDTLQQQQQALSVINNRIAALRIKPNELWQKPPPETALVQQGKFAFRLLTKMQDTPSRFVKKITLTVREVDTEHRLAELTTFIVRTEP